MVPLISFFFFNLANLPFCNYTSITFLNIKRFRIYKSLVSHSLNLQNIVKIELLIN